MKEVKEWKMRQKVEQDLSKTMALMLLLLMMLQLMTTAAINLMMIQLQAKTEFPIRVKWGRQRRGVDATTR